MKTVQHSAYREGYQAGIEVGSKRLPVLEAALRNAKSSLTALAGDPRKIYKDSNGRFGDAIQCAVLDEIDAALKGKASDPGPSST